MQIRPKCFWLWPLALALIVFAIAFGTWSVVDRYGFGFGEGSSKTITTTTRDANGNVIQTTEKFDSGKTLWDWLSLLGVPLSLAGLGYVFQQQQQKRAEAEAKEEVLQVYFDRLSTLLVDKNLLAIAAKVYPREPSESHREISPEDKELFDAAVDIIRARTLSILRRFADDVERKTSVIRFLIEVEVISKARLNLSGADLSRADLMGVNLEGADLSDAKLSGANLFLAKLEGAKLSGANLSGADLLGANLSGANLEFADLSFADLSCAYLTNAYLSHANLAGANLIGADLWFANLENIKFNPGTKWPAKEEVAKAKNIPLELMKQLGIEPKTEPPTEPEQKTEQS